jgi:hypothetical protein
MKGYLPHFEAVLREFNSSLAVLHFGEETTAPAVVSISTVGIGLVQTHIG